MKEATLEGCNGRFKISQKLFYSLEFYLDPVIEVSPSTVN